MQHPQPAIQNWKRATTSATGAQITNDNKSSESEAESTRAGGRGRVQSTDT